MDLKNLATGWPALVSLIVGFGTMVPFMNTGLLVGPVAKALEGADLSFYVGFVVAAALYLPLRKLEVPNPALGRDETGKPHVEASETA